MLAHFFCVGCSICHAVWKTETAVYTLETLLYSATIENGWISKR